MRQPYQLHATARDLVLNTTFELLRKGGKSGQDRWKDQVLVNDEYAWVDGAMSGQHEGYGDLAGEWSQ